jgi:hypothetical protein
MTGSGEAVLSGLNGTTEEAAEKLILAVGSEPRALVSSILW